MLLAQAIGALALAILFKECVINRACVRIAFLIGLVLGLIGLGRAWMVHSSSELPPADYFQWVGSSLLHFTLLGVLFYYSVRRKPEKPIPSTIWKPYRGS